MRIFGRSGVWKGCGICTVVGSMGLGKSRS